MCYFCAYVEYDFYIGQQFEQTTDISIGFSRTCLQKNFFMKTFGVRIIEVRIIEDALYLYIIRLYVLCFILIQVFRPRKLWNERKNDVFSNLKIFCKDNRQHKLTKLSSELFSDSFHNVCTFLSIFSPTFATFDRLAISTSWTVGHLCPWEEALCPSLNYRASCSVMPAANSKWLLVRRGSSVDKASQGSNVELPNDAWRRCKKTQGSFWKAGCGKSRWREVQNKEGTVSYFVL